MVKALSLAKLSMSSNCWSVTQVPAPQLPVVPMLVHQPVEAIVASVEDRSHPITVLHLQLYVLVLQQHLHHLNVPRPHGQHEGGEAGWPHVQRGAAKVNRHPLIKDQLPGQVVPPGVAVDVQEVHLPQGV